MMTGPELRAIRQSLGLSQAAFGRALGYGGTEQSLKTTIYRLEKSLRDEIPPAIARLARMYQRHGIPDDWAA